MAGKTIAILGAGTGGLVAASRLRRMLDSEHRIVLINRSPVYTFEPSLTRVMLGERSAGRISRDLRALAKKGIDFRTAEVTGINAEAQKVNIESGVVAYDYLVVALGADYSGEDVPGLGCAWSFYHADGAEALREELAKFTGGRIAVVAPRLPYKCPPALYEGAMLLDHYFRRRKLRDRVDIHVYTPEPAPLRAAGEAIGARVLEMLSARGIGFTGGVELQTVDQPSRALNFGQTQAEFDMLVAVPVHRAPHVLTKSGLLPEGRWVTVDRETLATALPNVYAIGDVTEVPLANGAMAPKSGVFAHGEAEVVARNIAAEVRGADPIWAFGGQGACFMETGGGKAAYITGKFFAEPAPLVEMRGPSRTMRLAKSGFERVWLWRWF